MKSEHPDELNRRLEDAEERRLRDEAAAKAATEPPDVVEVSNLEDPSRSCGDCTACCSYYAIPELGVEMGSTCPLLSKSGSGCTIHGEAYAPPVCTTYLCLWRLGNFDDEQRPDRMPKSALRIMLGKCQLDRYVDDNPHARSWSPSQILEAFLRFGG